MLVIKNLPASAGDPRDAGLIPGSGRSPGGRHDNPLQCSCLENPMDRGAWRAAVHGVAESGTTEHTHAQTHCRVPFPHLHAEGRTGKPGRLQSMGSQRGGHGWETEQQTTAPSQGRHPSFHSSQGPEGSDSGWYTHTFHNKHRKQTQVLRNFKSNYSNFMSIEFNNKILGLVFLCMSYPFYYSSNSF